MRALVLVVGVLLAGCVLPRAYVVPDPPAAVEGEVIRGILGELEGDDFAPLGGVTVRWMLDLDPARSAEYARRTVGEGVTDADGRFVLPRPAPVEGYFSLWCETDAGWHLLDGWLWDEDDASWEQGQAFTILPRDRPWRVQVVDEDGMPVEGATVEPVISVGGAPVGELRPALRTDTDGVAVLRHIEGDNYWADLFAPGYAPVRMATHQFFEPLSPDAVDRHVLPRGREVTGTVQLEDGSWPERVMLSVSYDSRRGGTEYVVPVREDGRFRVVVPVSISSSLYATAAGGGSVDFEIGDATHVVLVLQPAEE